MSVYSDQFINIIFAAVLSGLLVRRQVLEKKEKASFLGILLSF